MQTFYTKVNGCKSEILKVDPDETLADLRANIRMSDNLAFKFEGYSIRQEHEKHFKISEMLSKENILEMENHTSIIVHTKTNGTISKVYKVNPANSLSDFRKSKKIGNEFVFLHEGLSILHEDEVYFTISDLTEDSHIIEMKKVYDSEKSNNCNLVFSKEISELLNSCNYLNGIIYQKNLEYSSHTLFKKKNLNGDEYKSKFNEKNGYEVIKRTNVTIEQSELLKKGIFIE
jgi:hypothetical protein